MIIDFCWQLCCQLRKGWSKERASSRFSSGLRLCMFTHWCQGPDSNVYYSSSITSNKSEGPTPKALASLASTCVEISCANHGHWQFIIQAMSLLMRLLPSTLWKLDPHEAAFRTYSRARIGCVCSSLPSRYQLRRPETRPGLIVESTQRAAPI